MCRSCALNEDLKLSLNRNFCDLEANKITFIVILFYLMWLLLYNNNKL